MKISKFFWICFTALGLYTNAQATPLGSLVFNEPTGTVGPNDVVNVSLKFTLDTQSENIDFSDLSNLPTDWLSLTSKNYTFWYACSDSFSGGCGFAPNGHPYAAEFNGAPDGYGKIQEGLVLNAGDSIDFVGLIFTPNPAPVPSGTYSLFRLYIQEDLSGTKLQEQFDQDGNLIVDQDGHAVLIEAPITESKIIAETCPDYNGQGCSGNQIFTRTVVSVPEPEMYVMWFAGLGLMGFVSRRRLAA